MLRLFTRRVLARNPVSRILCSMVSQSRCRNIAVFEKRFSTNVAEEPVNEIQDVEVQNMPNMDEVHVAPVDNNMSSILVHTNIDLEGLTIWNPYQTINLTHTQSRENCRCDMCTVKPSMHRNPQFTHEFFVDHNIDNNIFVQEANIDENVEYIYLKWSDMHEGWISIEEILYGSASAGLTLEETASKTTADVNECSVGTDAATDELNADAQLPVINPNIGYGFGNGIVHFWKAFDSCHEWQDFEYNDIMTNNASVLDLYQQLDRYGITLLRNCFPSNSSSLTVVECIAQRLSSHLHPTVFGTYFTVETIVNAVSPAYTNIGLLCHTDLPYYESTPEFFIFHCIAQECEYGGDSVYVDGFKVANEMRIHFPDEFEILSTVPVPFRDQQRGLWDLYAEKCIFEIKDQDKNSNLRDEKVVQRIMYNEGVRCSLHWNVQNKVKKEFYHALKVCTQMLQNPDFQYLVKLEAGDVQIFCNTRLLHGRKQFVGKRKFHGGYFQRDSMMGMRREIQKSLMSKNVKNIK